MNYFSESELKCKHCKEYHFNDSTLVRLNRLRSMYGKPVHINSGYRCAEYNTKMGYTQTHATGQAVDVRASRKEAYKILKIAMMMGFTGIGVKQKGEDRFLHLDDLNEVEGRPRPIIWSY